MPNDTLTIDNPTSAFPASKQDLSNLKKTAIDAANDLKSTATVHATAAKGQLQELASHVQEEGGEQLNKVKTKTNDLLDAARNYAVEQPLTCLGIALAVGVFVGLASRRSRRD